MENNIDKTMANEEANAPQQIDENKMEETVLVPENNKAFCPQCGFALDGQNFCPVCGCKISNNVSMPSVENTGKKKAQDKSIVVMLSVLITLLAGVCLYFLITTVIMPGVYYNKGVKALEDNNYNDAITYFQKADGHKDSEAKLEEAEDLKSTATANEALEKQKQKMASAYKLCTSTKASLSYDGLSITIDSSSKYDSEGPADIVIVIYALDLPESLVDEMSSTNALMGRQTRTYNGIEVSWSYHPDNGLDAIFKIIG